MYVRGIKCFLDVMILHSRHVHDVYIHIGVLGEKSFCVIVNFNHNISELDKSLINTLTVKITFNFNLS